VFHGDPNSAAAPVAEDYQTGVREGALGLLLFAVGGIHMVVCMLHGRILYLSFDALPLLIESTSLLCSF